MSDTSSASPTPPEGVTPEEWAAFQAFQAAKAAEATPAPETAPAAAAEPAPAASPSSSEAAGPASEPELAAAAAPAPSPEFGVGQVVYRPKSSGFPEVFGVVIAKGRREDGTAVYRVASFAGVNDTPAAAHELGLEAI